MKLKCLNSILLTALATSFIGSLAGRAAGTNVVFQDGFENSTVGQAPGTNDPAIGTYAVAGGGTSVQVLSGAAFGGPSGAHSGNNYLVLNRAGTGLRPSLACLFAGSPVSLTSNTLHVECYRWQPSATEQANNYGNIVLANSNPDTSFTSSAVLCYGISYDDLTWRCYNGSAYIETGLSFSGDSWDKVNMDWDGTHLTGSLNGGTPVPLSLMGTVSNTVDQLFFETSGGGTIFYLDDIIASVGPIIRPPTTMVSTVPANLQTAVPINTMIQVIVADGTQQVQTNSLYVLLNGAPVTPSITQAIQKGIVTTTINYTPPAAFAFGSTNTVLLTYQDNASPPNMSTINITFVAQTGVTLFADNFEQDYEATNQVQILPFQGTQFLEMNRNSTTGKAELFGANTNGATSNDGDLISIRFGVYVLTGEVSLYPRAASTTTAGTADTGQIGFFADDRVGIVDPTGSSFQFLTQKVETNAWNSVVVNYTNASGTWAVSVNGAPFESRSGMGSDGGSFGQDVTGLKLANDAPGIAYLDAFIITNETQGSLLFAANFDNGTNGSPPAANEPQVGTWYGIVNPAGLDILNGASFQVVTYAPPSNPQVGSYASATALVENATAISGTNSVYLYPALGQGEIRPRFIAPVPQGTTVHAQAWLYHVASSMHWGLDTPNDPLFANVTLQAPTAGLNGSITVADGTNDVDTGLSYADTTWQEYAIDYRVGSTSLVLTFNGQAVTNAVQAQNQVIGLWFECGLPNDDFQSRGFVDDVLASAPIVISTPPVLKYTVSGQQLTLSWTGAGFTLQANNSLSNPTGWTAIGSSSPATVTIGTSGNKFYRLVGP